MKKQTTGIKLHFENNALGAETGVGLGKQIAQYVNEKVKRTYWDNKKIRQLFGKRSAKEIINDGTTSFMNPCLDFTLVSASLMKSKNMEYDIIIEEHLPTKDFDFNRLHFVLEFKDKGEKYMLNYKSCNVVYVEKGGYAGRKDLPQAQIIKIPGEIIYPDKTIYENMGYGSLEELCEKRLKEYSLEKNLKRLERDNTIENYSEYQKNFGDGLIINPQPSDLLSA